MRRAALRATQFDELLASLCGSDIGGRLNISDKNNAVNRRIRGFHQDRAGHFVAELECGHHQYVRHAPPWLNRRWVTTPEGRAAAVGAALCCRICGHDEALVKESKPQPAI